MSLEKRQGVRKGGWAVFETLILQELFRFLVVKFCDELPCLTKPGWMTHLYIPHGIR
jgi:hypothetical protein